jgi:hypothetical protein
VAIADEIDALARRTKSDLMDLSDFGAHVHLIWKQFNLRVSLGDRIKSKNPRTRTEVTERDLVKRYARYRTTYVHGLGFAQLTTVLESFVFDFLRLLLTNETRHLAQRRQIEVGVVLAAADKEAIVSLIVERELNELKYDRPRAWFEFMNKVVNLGCPTGDEIERVAEMKAARDLVIHNSGVVNAIYLDKAGSKARYALGEKVVIDRTYFDECWTLARRLVDDIAAAAKRRLSKGGSP